MKRLLVFYLALICLAMATETEEGLETVNFLSQSEKNRNGFVMTGVQYWIRVGFMVLIAVLEYELATLWLIAYGIEWILNLVPAIMWLFVGDSAA